MGSNDWLLDLGVVKTDGVGEVRDIKSSDAVAERNGEVRELAVVGDLGVDGRRVLGLFSKVVELFSSTLASIGVLAVRVDDPDGTSADGSANRLETSQVACCAGYLRSKSSRLLVSGDELDILDTTTLGDPDGGDDLAVGQVPETKSVGVLDADGRFEDGDGHDVVGGEDQTIVPVNAQSVRAELLSQDTELQGVSVIRTARVEHLQFPQHPRATRG